MKQSKLTLDVMSFDIYLIFDLIFDDYLIL